MGRTAYFQLYVGGSARAAERRRERRSFPGLAALDPPMVSERLFGPALRPRIGFLRDLRLLGMLAHNQEPLGLSQNDVMR